MSKRKGVKKRYLITVSSILLAIISVLLLRFFDMDFAKQKSDVEKEIKVIMEFNRDFFKQAYLLDENTDKAEFLRDKFADKISYKKLFNDKKDFRNFKYLPDKNIYGFQMLNNTHVGFYYNSDTCGKRLEGKDYCAGVLIDINGYTRPNKFGKDQFLFKIYRDGIFE